MPNLAMAPIKLEVAIIGNLLPIVRAFGLLTDALATHGHRFSEAETALLAEALEVFMASTDRLTLCELDAVESLVGAPLVAGEARDG